jgi:hypothetical protein
MASWNKGGKNMNSKIIDLGNDSFVIIKDENSYSKVASEQVITVVSGSKKEASAEAKRLNQEKIRHVNI